MDNDPECTKKSGSSWKSKHCLLSWIMFKRFAEFQNIGFIIF